MTGVLALDKPEGPTSHDMVSIARRALGERRIGHTGTLDPFASGLLLLCVGVATRLAEYLTGLDKVYEATARLGVTTDTLDVTGTVLEETEAWRSVDEAAVRLAFEAQVGSFEQRPPAYSAKKLGGRRAYDLARAGRPVEPDPVRVTVHELSVGEVQGPDVTFRLRCSSGTYVRSIARDAGEALGVGAHLTALRRTAIGGFLVARALTPAELEDPDAVAAAMMTPGSALVHLPDVSLDAGAATAVRHGRPVPAPAGTPDGTVVLFQDADLVAVAESRDGLLRPRKVFA